MGDLEFEELTEEIIGCLLEVYNVLGCGFLEKLEKKGAIIRKRVGREVRVEKV